MSSNPTIRVLNDMVKGSYHDIVTNSCNRTMILLVFAGTNPRRLMVLKHSMHGNYQLPHMEGLVPYSQPICDVTFYP